MNYANSPNTPSLLSLLIRGAIISTKPAEPYPLHEERLFIGFEEEEKPVVRPSAVAMRPIVWKKVSHDPSR